MKTFTLLLLISISFGVQSQTQSKYIVIDQFGYRPVAEKIAVIRDPVIGFDANESFTPGPSYALVNASTNSKVFTADLTQYNAGTTDTSSGDRTWWFNFSSYQTPGTYYILDIDKNLKSYDFEIKEGVYKEVLKHAVRTFFYQRSGFAKDTQYASENWTDGASHIGALQDAQCRSWDRPNDASTEKDLSGGWYDAGDYSKYTTWTANYIVDLLKAYKENPIAFTDDYNLPDSGNGTPDIIDEVIWGMDHLLRMQNEDGSTISIVGVSHSSPPSSANGQSVYGGVNTSSTLASAAAFAYGSSVFSELGMSSYANTLLNRAQNAWEWAEANPNVVWKNNDNEYNSVGVGAGQQETNDYGRFMYKMKAAAYLFYTTGNSVYKTFFENNYKDAHMMQWNYAYPFEQENQEIMLYYAAISNVNPTISNDINTTYANAMNSNDINFPAFTNEKDPYMAYLADYTWGSNNTKSRKAGMYTDYIKYNINTTNNDNAFRAAERYLHYIHGVNPLNFCYLSNMYDYGADNGVNEFYHTWFGNDTDWDNVKDDLYGPAPGYVVGGPNPSYDWDSCCNSSCGSPQSNQKCNANQVTRIKGQPAQKSYDDFNTSWPMNSWSVTENSNGYQVAYIKLLSKFVSHDSALSTKEEFKKPQKLFTAYPNPFKNSIFLKSNQSFDYKIFDIRGRLIAMGTCNGECNINNNSLNSGVYFIKVKSFDKTETIKIIKK